MSSALIQPAYVLGIVRTPEGKYGGAHSSIRPDDLEAQVITGLIERNPDLPLQELNLDPDKVNVNGGAIAIGHPLGASGARIPCTLLHEMKRRNLKYGLAALCAGVGQGAAVIYENCQ